MAVRLSRGFVIGGVAAAALIAAAIVAAILLIGGGWREYRSAEGGFTVSLPPGKFSERTRGQGDRTVRVVLVEIDAATAYGVTYSREPNPGGTAPQDILVETQRRILARIGASVTDAKPIALGAVPGREFAARLPKGSRYLARVYVAGRDPVRLYVLIVVGADPARIAADTRRFFDSFKLTE